MKDTPIITAAKMLAGEAHKGQMRKYGGLPYIIHPIEVATIVEEAGGTDDMIAAALLHDVVEDCPGYTFETIADKVSPKVAELVRGMTEASKPEDGNRATRKEIDKNFLAEQSAEVQTIKYADVISNSKDIRVYDPKFAEVYFTEIKALLEVMDKGDPALYQKAKEIVYSS
jgi:(p)ppGpp synthase/HD superfamily hydrolase